MIGLPGLSVGPSSHSTFDIRYSIFDNSSSHENPKAPGSRHALQHKQYLTSKVYIQANVKRRRGRPIGYSIPFIQSTTSPISNFQFPMPMY